MTDAKRLEEAIEYRDRLKNLLTFKEGIEEWRGGIQMVNVAAQASGNADILIGFMLRHGRDHGHNSALLHMFERMEKSSA